MATDKKPDHLRALVREAIEQHIDEEELYALRREEEAAKKALAQMADYVPYLDSNDDETDDPRG